MKLFGSNVCYLKKLSTKITFRDHNHMTSQLRSSKALWHEISTLNFFKLVWAFCMLDQKECDFCIKVYLLSHLNENSQNFLLIKTWYWNCIVLQFVEHIIQLYCLKTAQNRDGLNVPIISILSISKTAKQRENRK